ncbi:hypothetical protein CGL56_11425 [Neolewinella marina]|uniref:Uncharacterized protein n=1 Tax=Neolewinella marina TaxID=438751 RepID=A0A2G0CEB8_9BACT|nr:hypothetical protein CGL56_11425 [Neolewinella marina]
MDFLLLKSTNLENDTIQEYHRLVKRQLLSPAFKQIKKLTNFPFCTNREFDNAYYELSTLLKDGKLNILEYASFAQAAYSLIEIEYFMPFNKDVLDQKFDNTINLIRYDADVTYLELNSLKTHESGLEKVNKKLASQIRQKAAYIMEESIKSSRIDYVSHISPDTITNSGIRDLYSNANLNGLIEFINANFENRNLLDAMVHEIKDFDGSFGSYEYNDRITTNFIGLAKWIEEENTINKAVKIDRFWWYKIKSAIINTVFPKVNEEE